MKFMQGRPQWLLAVLVALGIATVSLGLDVGEASAQDTTVAIVDFAFQPASVTVAVGSTVTWSNGGAAPHTVTSSSGAFDSGTLQPGASFSHTFDTVGTFSYFCSIHPSMTGTITVTESGAAAAPAPAAAATTPAAAAPAPAAQVRQMPSTGVGAAHDAKGIIMLLLALAVASFGLATHLAVHRR